jgi:hypothetical protein
MTSLLVEIERGLLTDSERRNPHWFPRWFTYDVTEAEKREWQDFVEKNPLKLGYEPEKVMGQEKEKAVSSTPQPTSSAQSEGRNAQAATPTGSQAASTSTTRATAAPPTSSPSSQQPMKQTSTEANTSSPKATHLPQNESSPSATVQPSSAPSQRSPAVQASESESLAGNSAATAQIVGLPPTDIDAPLTCRICDLPGTKVCTGCRKVRYCTAEHQTLDWKEHKKSCKPKGKAKAVEGYTI